MNNGNFSYFMSMLDEAMDDNNHPVWYAGYLWLRLTDRQAKKVYDKLAPKYKVGDEVRTPNGIIIKK